MRTWRAVCQMDSTDDQYNVSNLNQYMLEGLAANCDTDTFK